MRIGRWNGPDGIGEGIILDDRVIAFPDGVTVADVLARGLDEALRLGRAVEAEQGVPRDAVELLAPLVPASIRDFVAFEEHVEGISASVDGASEVVPEWYQLPTFYFTNPHSVRASGEVVDVPETARLDFELELAVVIGAVPGSDGANLDVEAAASHIFGYTVMNDWSARDLQAREMKVRLGPAKGKDFATTLGPWIVTADEFADRLDGDGFLPLHAEVSINGERVGEDRISNMGWPFPELVAYAARNSVVRPGDVLGSGTVGNGGCLGELWGRSGELSPPPLEPGDEVRMVIEGVGEIVNTVGQRVPAPPIPAARKRPRNR
ncbi:Ureidoglycolate lyase [Microbacterium lemovicicum]|uniref:Ureidoglycolate lyase n=1 Tax=Microbacterium lemovicicum TaxID=1072463 RepID=A0A3Q9J462_9MICO|nr:fumarylacetoacetate hydrolase family protein [Microbacterium lemovicicum]AZS37461.1 Ureidoglycolate lyase [Microbacterium lemovicicum]